MQIVVVDDYVDVNVNVYVYVYVYVIDYVHAASPQLTTTTTGIDCWPSHAHVDQSNRHHYD